MVKILVIFFALSTALLETIGATGSSLVWFKETRIKGILLVILGFGGSIVAYVLMRRYIENLVLAQSIFIAGVAVFTVAVAIFSKNIIFNLQIFFGLVLISIGSIIINQYIPD